MLIDKFGGGPVKLYITIIDGLRAGAASLTGRLVVGRGQPVLLRRQSRSLLLLSPPSPLFPHSGDGSDENMVGHSYSVFMKSKK